MPPVIETDDGVCPEDGESEIAELLRHQARGLSGLNDPVADLEVGVQRILLGAVPEPEEEGGTPQPAPLLTDPAKRGPGRPRKLAAQEVPPAGPGA